MRRRVNITNTQIEQPVDKPTPAQIYATAKSFGFVPIGLNGKVPFQKGWDTITLNNSDKYFKEAEAKYDGHMNIGVLTGKPSGIVVIDVDIREEGVKKWYKLLSENKMPNTFSVLTGSGGYHYYFKYDQSTERLHNGKIRNYGIDFKSTGGQVVFAGSTHPNTGKLYLVDGGYVAPNDGGKTPVPVIAAMPKWLLEMVVINQ